MVTLKIFLLLISGITFSLFLSQGVANAEIIVTPPPNWQPVTNNSTLMLWIQNSTKSVFMIAKAPHNVFVLPLFFVGPAMGQFFADKGILESADQITFGHSNYGYRYILNISSVSSMLVNSSSDRPIQENSLLFALNQTSAFPFKMVLILTQKKDDMYAIMFGSPINNFELMLKETKPTLDSIQLTNTTEIPN